jgi:ABC-type dipeptide/oligopeptide/nickel transport system permease component
MGVYIARRLLWIPFLLLAVTSVTFTLGQYGPGDPVEVLLGQHYNPDVVERIRRQRGLDRPFHEQYASYIWNLLHGDFGESFKYPGRSVGKLIVGKIWVSSQLGIAAMILTIGIGIPLGLISALKQGTWKDSVIVSTTLFFLALPVFITIPVMLLVLVLHLHWLPSSGWGGFFSLNLIIPALSMGIPGIASITRLMRASTLDVMGQDFIRTARAKGLSEFVVQYRHVMRNALIPIITILGFAVADLVGGAFIVETMYGIPGIGRLAVDSIFARDYPVIMALTVIVATAFVIGNLLADISYGLVDPRIRYE